MVLRGPGALKRWRVTGVEPSGMDSRFSCGMGLFSWDHLPPWQEVPLSQETGQRSSSEAEQTLGPCSWNFKTMTPNNPLSFIQMFNTSHASGLLCQVQVLRIKPELFFSEPGLDASVACVPRMYQQSPGNKESPQQEGDPHQPCRGGQHPQLSSQVPPAYGDSHSGVHLLD